MIKGFSLWHLFCVERCVVEDYCISMLSDVITQQLNNEKTILFYTSWKLWDKTCILRPILDKQTICSHQIKESENSWAWDPVFRSNIHILYLLIWYVSTDLCCLCARLETLVIWHMSNMINRLRSDILKLGISLWIPASFTVILELYWHLSPSPHFMDSMYFSGAGRWLYVHISVCMCLRLETYISMYFMFLDSTCPILLSPQSCA